MRSRSNERREPDKTRAARASADHNRQLKEAIKDLPDDTPVYVCCEGFDTEARLIEICEERLSTTGHMLDPRRLVIDEDD
jgi:hypothetical protein